MPLVPEKKMNIIRNQSWYTKYLIYVAMFTSNNTGIIILQHRDTESKESIVDHTVGVLVSIIITLIFSPFNVPL